MSQRDAILKHLKSGKAITSKMAYDLYGCTRLAAVIHHWKGKGVKIVATKRSVINRFGNPGTIAFYTLKNEYRS